MSWLLLFQKTIFDPPNWDEKLWLERQDCIKDNADLLENYAVQLPGNVTITFIFLINIYLLYSQLFPEVIS